ncbi:MAG: fibronectin type III domain-containing protein [Patescibacteria group bacterium]|jgi:hypothetical protein
MKKNLLVCVSAFLSVLFLPTLAMAAGISVSSGSLKYPGDEATGTVTASGTTFNAFSGTIGSGGVIKIVSCSPGDALWVNKPNGAGSFAGALTEPVSSFRIASCKLRASTTGSGTFSVSGVSLADKGPIVGTDGDSTSFSIVRRPTPPGAISISSATHADQNTSYEANTVILSWDRPSNITGFSYLLDQTADTIPGAKVTSNEMTVTYADQAIGTYYFHIRGQNNDGFGDTSHFKIMIKEPDPKIKEEIAKPSDISISKTSDFKNIIADGTASGIKISGLTLPEYMANIKLEPSPKIPEGKLMSAKADANGRFEFLIDFPIPAGSYILTVQGQNNKTLTPVSDPIRFELSQKEGGSIQIVTASDENVPIIPPKKWHEKVNWLAVSIAIASLWLISAAIIVTLAVRKKINLKKFTKLIG